MNRRQPRLTIDQLNLRLPAGYAERADAIARETARQLARLSLPTGTDLNLASTTAPVLRIHGGESDRVIARRIAQGISRQLTAAPVAASADLRSARPGNPTRASRADHRSALPVRT